MDNGPWSGERVELLMRLWAGGATADSIGVELGGLSRSAVLGKIFRLRLRAARAAPSPPIPPAADNGALRYASDETRRTAHVPLMPAGAPMRRRRSAARRAVPSADSEPRAKGKSLLELTNTECRWPHGSPGTASFLFCGAPGADLERGRPYCARHARRAYFGHHDSVESAASAASADPLPTESPAARRYVWRPAVRHPAARWR